MPTDNPVPITAVVVVEVGPKWVATVIAGKRRLYRDVRSALRAALKLLEARP